MMITKRRREKDGKLGNKKREQKEGDGWIG